MDLKQFLRCLGGCLTGSACAAQEAELVKMEKDAQYYEARIATLTEALANAITLPDISPYIEPKTSCEPYQVIEPYGKYDILCADYRYYALALEKWSEILSLVQPQVKAVLKAWVEEISDCDDWALLMASFVASAFACVQPKLGLQGAFCVIWSNSHAYNGYITTGGKVMIYEPQNGDTIGELGQTVEQYDSRYIWFLS